MRRILIDTNIYVAFKRNDPDVVKTFQNCDLIGIDIAVIAELNCGFLLGGMFKKNDRELRKFLNHIRVQIYDHNAETAEFYARIYKNLRIKGKPIPTNDIWIAAAAMQNGLALYSRDQHFDCVDGLIRYE